MCSRPRHHLWRSTLFVIQRLNTPSTNTPHLTFPQYHSSRPYSSTFFLPRYYNISRPATLATSSSSTMGCGAGLHPHPVLSSPTRRERTRITCCKCHHRTYRTIGQIKGVIRCANVECFHDLMSCEVCEWVREKMIWWCWACERRNRGTEVRCFRCAYPREVECVLSWAKG